MNKKISFVLLASLLILLLSGCTTQTEKPITGGYITGVTMDETSAGQNANFIITVDQAQADIGLDFWASFQEGSVNISLVNKTTEEVAYTQQYEGELVNENTVITLPQGEYDLLVSWDGPVKGSYNLEWQPGQVEVPKISPIILLPGIGMLIVGILFFYYGSKQSRISMALLGGGFWAGTVVVKFIISVVFNSALYQWIMNALPGLPGTIIFSIYVGLLTGITEVLITWLILRNTKIGQRIWGEIVAFSLGFGAIEAILLGAFSLIGMITILSMQGQLPIGTLRNAAMSNNFFTDLAPILERFFTILIHYACNLLIFFAIFKKETRWFWASFALKSGIDAIAGYAQISGRLSSPGFIWIIEIFVILFGVASYFISKKLSPELKELSTPMPEKAEA